MNGAIGLDFATQSARAILIGDSGEILARFNTNLAEVELGPNNSKTQDPKSWLYALEFLLDAIAVHAKTNSIIPTSLSITATSGTFLLCDDEGRPITPAVMYNDGTANTPLARASKLGFTDSNFKHVPEFLISYLTREKNIPADWSHALKTGVNLKTKTWNIDSNFRLPELVAPGTFLGEIHSSLPLAGVKIYAGMTDGCTAQISAGGTNLGSAVTTIGTTLVTKIVSDKDISGPGFYSHLIPPETWLAGGASNLGGIALKKFNDLDYFNKEAEKFGPANRVVYPLTGVGERFPIPNSEMTQIENQKSDSEIEEFRSILEGIAFAERLSYEILNKAGSPNLKVLNSVGGGTKSKLWSEIRATVLGQEVITRTDAGSDLGAAMLALASSRDGELATNLSKIPLQKGLTYKPNLQEKSKLDENYLKFLELSRHFRKDQ